MNFIAVTIPARPPLNTAKEATNLPVSTAVKATRDTENIPMAFAICSKASAFNCVWMDLNVPVIAEPISVRLPISFAGDSSNVANELNTLARDLPSISPPPTLKPDKIALNSSLFKKPPIPSIILFKTPLTLSYALDKVSPRVFKTSPIAPNIEPKSISILKLDTKSLILLNTFFNVSIIFSPALERPWPKSEVSNQLFIASQILLKNPLT